MSIACRLIVIAWKLTKLIVMLAMIRCFGQENAFCVLSTLSMTRDRVMVTRTNASISDKPARTRAA